MNNLVGEKRPCELVGVGGEEGPQRGTTSIEFSDLRDKPLGHTWSILFWTKEQLNLLDKLRSGENVVLCGDYGTGKTSLLVFAALEAAKDPQCKVFFIPVANLSDGDDQNVLDEAVKIKFEGTAVTVITMKDIGMNRRSATDGDDRHQIIREFLERTVQKDKNIKVFIDELPLFKEDLKQLQIIQLYKKKKLPIQFQTIQLAKTFELLESHTTQTWVALSTLSLLDNSEYPNKPVFPGMNMQKQDVKKTGFSTNSNFLQLISLISALMKQNTKFTLQELKLRVRNSSSIGNSTPESISDLSKGINNFQTRVIKEASSAHTVQGVRPVLLDLEGIPDSDFSFGMNEVFSKVLKMKTTLTHNIAVLCGEDVSVSKVCQAVSGIGFCAATFPPSPSAEQEQQLRTWLKGGGGLLVTSNLRFAGMEAPTCVFITKNIIEETGARSGLLRATSRLVVVSYTKDIDLLEMRKRFVVHCYTEERRRQAADLLPAVVNAAAAKGNLAHIKHLQQDDNTGNLSLLLS